MRRCSIILLMVLSFVVVAAAQSRVVVNGGGSSVATAIVVAPPESGKATPDDTVARIMMFDSNHDGKIAKDELSERMQNLLMLADRNADGVLDENEIHAVANTASPAPQRFRGFPESGGYGFSDDPGVSSRLHFDGALDDLKLASATREKAGTVVDSFVESIEGSAIANFMNEMQALLTPAQLGELRVAVNHPTQFMEVRGSGDSGPRAVFIGMNLQRLILKYALPSAENQRALAAVEKFNAAFRLVAPQRAALLEQLKDILSDEERDNFRASIERRPLSHGGLMVGLSGGVVSGVTLDEVGGIRARD